MFTMEGINIGIFGRATWNLKNPDSFRKTAPRYGTPKTPREIEQYVEYESPAKLKDLPRDRRVTINLNSMWSMSPPLSLKINLEIEESPLI